ncbi:glycosyltransferase [Thiomicrospira microaerophila]|uniref:glycosyltransferase n=1 Tax=Thiomicrospira microaerophila TaxID=406020 RepID=UPI00200EFC17|nr:glycosyltransferase [Thiomicrospira microaerophila]UQB42433.1 glycosyltransferase [Thiomicrospira microaerophila]
MKVLCITDCQDRPETELYILLSQRVDNFLVMANPDGRFYGLLVQNGVRVQPIKIKSRFDKKATQLIQQVLLAEQFDIVHAFNTRAVACMLRAGKNTRSKLLAYRGVTTGVGYLKPESWHTFLNPRLDGVMCVADAIRQALVNTRFLWLSFPAHKAKTIYKGHNPAWYEGTAVPKTSLGVPEDAKAICCIARNSLKKGVGTLLDAFRQLDAELNAHLVLVGGIDKNLELKERIRQAGLVERVHFTGYRNDAIQIVRGCDLLVSASESGEGLPRVAIEAMCVGTPVVATDSGGTREVVIDGQTGLLVEKGAPAELSQAIAQVLSDTALREQLSVQGLGFVANELTPENTVDNVIQWYEDLCFRAGVANE